MSDTVTRVLQRQIMPEDRDLDVISLYVDPAEASLDADKLEVGSNRNVKAMNAAAKRQAMSSGEDVHPDQILSRYAFRLPQGDRISFGTYFNAFPASYWRRWTVVKDVTLKLRVVGAGATVTVYRSMANGRSQRVDSEITTEAQNELSFDLTLKPFADGGWYWYDLIAGDQEAILESAEWVAQVPADRAEHGTVTVGITTMNRPDFCARLLGQLGDDDTLADYLDEVLMVEQGTDKVVDSAYFSAAQKALGDKLRVIEQGNLGGSGGYARGQLETLRKGDATYFMCMDDDVVCEPEGIVRAVTFADLCRRPTLVGGHMFSLFAKSRLHSFGEVVQPWRFWWQSAPEVENDWDFAARNLRSARWLHRRVDVDFNGWFMCLIPTQVLDEIGLSLPLFIKWDDSEYGLRAKAAGYGTVTLPGAAVWHVPWTDKNDALDWQSFFHQRNRFVAALLHSPFKHGGRMVRESLNHQIKHLISMQYSTVMLRHQALLDVLDGPQGLHPGLESKLPEVRAAVKEYTDAQLQPDPDSFAPARIEKPRRKDNFSEVASRVSMLKSAVTGTLRQFAQPREMSRSHPERVVAAADARWYRLATLDSAVVSMPDGTSTALYQREPELFKTMLKETVALHERLYREWPELAQRYRDSLAEITSPDAWADTFNITEGESERV